MKPVRWALIVLAVLALAIAGHLSSPSRLVQIRKEGADRVAAEKERQTKEIETLLLRQREELAAARGGGLDAFLKDPELSMTQMLCQAAAHLAPEWNPEVAAEDFTDFELTLHVPAGPLAAPMRAFLKSYLPAFGSYLAIIRLVSEGGTFGEVDRVEIRQAERWLNNDERLAWAMTGIWRDDEAPVADPTDDRPTPDDSEFDVQWVVGEDGKPALLLSRASGEPLLTGDTEDDLPPQQAAQEKAAAEKPPEGPREASLDPVTAAREFHANHYRFFDLEDDLPRIKEFVTPEFYDAMSRIKADGMVIDVDPWLHAQDGYVSSPVDFRLASQTGDVAVVHMAYDFTLNETEVYTTALHFVRSAADSRWRLDELIGPEGWPLARIPDNIEKE